MNGFEFILIIPAILALAACAFLYWQIRSLARFKQAFFKGTQAQDLEHVIYSLVAKIDSLHTRQEVLENYFSTLKNHSEYNFSKLGIVRFNPFKDDGGNFSFSLALLNAHNSGFILTSMHGRQQCRVYTKQLHEGRSEVQITAEEMQAVQMAIDQTKTEK